MTCPNGAGDWKDKTMNLEGKRVLVVGSGKSGVAAAELLRKKGITFVLFDGNKDLDVTALIEKNPVFAGAEILLGELAPEDMARIDLVVLSPGVPTDLPMVNELRNRQIPIWGEIEFAAIIFVNTRRLKRVQQEFDDVVRGWSGQLVKSVSISCGYVSSDEKDWESFDEMVKAADERMYENKAAYYRQKGVDRRYQ